MMTVTRTHLDLNLRYIMARQTVNPAEYGIDLDKDALADELADEFNVYSRGMLTLDELLLRPRTALHFCDATRHNHGWFDLPDDVLLRLIMNWGKRPSG
jgi:hypothetical protein